MLPHPLNEPGPILSYIAKLMASGNKDLQRAAKEATEALKRLLSTPDGHILMDLLDKSVVQNLTPVLDDPRALGSRNAQGFILSDLRRIASNETELLARTDAPSPRRAGRNTGRAGRSG